MKHKFDFPAKFDASDKHGAGLLCECVVAYWAARGYLVRAERFLVREGSWGIRSSLVNGLPVRRRGL